MRFFLAGIVSFLFVFGVFADDNSSIKDEINLLKQRLRQLEDKLEAQEKQSSEESQIILRPDKDTPSDQYVTRDQDTPRDKDVVRDKDVPRDTEIVKEKDLKHVVEPYLPGTFKIGGNITGIVQSSPDAILWGAPVKSATGASYQANVYLENEFNGIDGLAYANLRVGEGQGIEDKLTVYSNVDNNACNDSHFFLNSMYYEQHLCNNTLTINFGKLDPTDFFDKNDFAGSDTSQFLSRIFNNSPVIEFPENSGGIHIATTPYKWLELGYLVMSSNTSMTNFPNDLFHIGRVVLKPQICERQGNYRVLAWYNGGDHTRWSDTNQTEEHNYGVALSIDQELTDNFGVFGKFGWQRPSVYNPEKAANVSSDAPANADYFSLEYMWSTGINVKGNLWDRSKDFCGIGIGQTLPSGDMRRYMSRNGRHEGHLEAYYNFFVNPYLSITPGVQVINKPYGKDIPNSKENIALYYLRAHVDF